MAYYAVDCDTGKLIGGIQCPDRRSAALSNGPGPAGRHYGPENSYIIEVCETKMSPGWVISLPAPIRGASAPVVRFEDRIPGLEPLTEFQAATAGAAAIHGLLQLDKGYGS